MKFTTNKIKDNEIEVIINASSGKFAEYIEKAFKEQVKEVEADGFRKGKMPKNTFIKKYGIERLYPEAIDILLNEQYKILLEKDIPIFGICLGHQLLSIASGAKTEKMKFGHHGANHPVQNLADGTVMVTSQNHGFTVSETDFPASLSVTHRSLFDGTLQGIARTDVPAYSFQGHPETSPGPHDAASLFEHFIKLMEDRR